MEVWQNFASFCLFWQGTCLNIINCNLQLGYFFLIFHEVYMITKKLIKLKVKQAIKEKCQFSLGCGSHTTLDIKPSGACYFFLLDTALMVNLLAKR